MDEKGVWDSKQGWVLFADIYGFKGLLSESELPKTAERLRLYVQKVFNFLDSRSSQLSIKHAAFSDLITIFSPIQNSTIDEFRKFSDLCQAICNIAADYDFLLRGAITFGHAVTSETFILGDAYLRAYKIESQALFYPIIAVLEQDLESANIARYFKAEIHEIPSKSGSSTRGITLPSVPFEKIGAIAEKNILQLSMEAGHPSHKEASTISKSPLETWKEVWEHSNRTKIARKNGRIV